MKITKVLIPIVFLGFVFSAVTICGQQEQKKAAEVKLFKYVGVKKCKPCHMSAKKGAQYKKWKAGPHAKAYTDLASDTSKQVAKKAGVKGDPQGSEKCLECHVTAYGVADSLKAKTLTLEEGVSCETCHGPGSEYKSAKVMKALAAGTQKPEEVGYWEITEARCAECHNKRSPTYREFKFKEKVAVIAHPAPPKE